MEPTEEQINTAAKMLAAAYWRGRLFAISEMSPLTNAAIVEGMIDAAAERSLDSWRGSARALLSMI